MHPNFGDWYRAATLVPNHDDLATRQTAIDSFVEEITKKQIIELSHGFYGIGLQNESVSELRDAMHEADNAFAMKDNDIELRVLAGACLIEVLNVTGETIPALTLVCPALMGSREKILVPDICEHASQFLNDRSLELRKPKGLLSPRATVPKIKDSVAGITTAAASNQFNTSVGEHMTTALVSLHSSMSSLVRKCNKLASNQSLFREDSDILWWLTGGYSRDLEKPIKEIDIAGASVVVGKELADLIHVQPGPYAAQAVLDRCLQHHGGSLKSYSLSQIVNKTPPEWKVIWRKSLADNDGVLTLCPVANAVATSVELSGERAWQATFKARTGVNASLKRPLIDWAFQTYRESMLIREFGN